MKISQPSSVYFRSENSLEVVYKIHTDDDKGPILLRISDLSSSASPTSQGTLLTLCANNTVAPPDT